MRQKNNFDEKFFEGLDAICRGDLIQFSPFFSVNHIAIVIDVGSPDQYLDKQLDVYSFTDDSMWKIYLYLDTINILSKSNPKTN